MEVIDVSFKHLLLKLTKKLSLFAPKYGFTVDTSGQLNAYVDVDIERGDTVIETIRSWGSPTYVAGTSEEDVARNSINTLREDLGFNVRDTNFEDLKIYKDLYQQLSGRYNALVSKHNMRKWDYKFLKKCYGKAIDKRDRYCAEHFEIQQSLERVTRPGMVINVPAEGAAQELSTAQDPSTASE